MKKPFKFFMKWNEDNREVIVKQASMLILLVMCILTACTINKNNGQEAAQNPSLGNNILEFFLKARQNHPVS